jgi:hypothetical protein
VYLTFLGLREANVRDRATRLGIALPVVQAARLWRMPGERLTNAGRVRATLELDDTASQSVISYAVIEPGV